MAARRPRAAKTGIWDGAASGVIARWLAAVPGRDARESAARCLRPLTSAVPGGLRERPMW